MTFNELIHAEKPVLVDFFAKWCGPCQMMAPLLNEIKQEIGDSASIVKVDIDRNQDAANAYQVQSVPTFILFKNGKVMWRQTGAIPKKGLIDVIKKFSV